MSSVEAGHTITPEKVTAQALASFDAAPDPRLRQVMKSLTAHLHGFITEVELTEAEWAGAIAMLTATGHITDERRQEFILWSDTLGVSMLVDALAHPARTGATESTVLGPFYVPGSPRRELGGQHCRARGRSPGAGARARAGSPGTADRRRRARRLAEREQPAVRSSGRARARRSPARPLRDRR